MELVLGPPLENSTRLSCYCVSRRQFYKTKLLLCIKETTRDTLILPIIIFNNPIIVLFLT